MRHLIFLFVFISLVISFVFTGEAKTSASDLYRVGINDMLEIKVLDYSDLRTIAAVAADGTISFPYIGIVHVKGMKLSEIEDVITKKLSEGYIKYPMVSVSLVKSMSRKIFIYGEINKQGDIPFEEGMTVLNAVSLSGGISEKGLYGKVKVRRKQKGESEYRDTEVDLKSIIEGSVRADMLLQPDDILIVERNKTFFIQGEVNKVGEFVLEKDMTVTRAISSAGGVTQNALYGKVRVKRKGKDELEYRDGVEISLNKGVIEAGEGGDMLLQPDDILIVERNKTFFIQGEVNKVGEFVLEKDMTVARALSTAGGVNPNGLYGKVRLKRKEEGKLEYKDIVEIGLSKGVIEAGEGGDMLLQPDDIVIVERNKTFFIYGEVNKPGEYVLEDKMTVFKALTIAGGFTKWGSPSRVKVLRPKNNGTEFTTIKVNINDVIKGDATADILLQPGDTVVASAGIL